VIHVTGKVVDGRVVIEKGTLPEGAVVYVYIRDDDFVDLTPEEEAELNKATAEADAGEGSPWEEVRERIFGKA
jgi:hypothetical protein